MATYHIQTFVRFFNSPIQQWGLSKTAIRRSAPSPYAYPPYRQAAEKHKGLGRAPVRYRPRGHPQDNPRFPIQLDRRDSPMEAQLRDLPQEGQQWLHDIDIVGEGEC